MCLLRHVLICSAAFNLLTFLIGLFLGILREDLLILSLVLTAVGLLGMLLFAITWLIRPKVIHRPIYFVKHWKEEKLGKDTTINPDTTEAVMKNIRGIPFLIQAIQYSMETTYYRDVLSEMGEGVVRTSVIHTAPACTSILDSESDDETKEVKITPRLSDQEQKRRMNMNHVEVELETLQRSSGCHSVRAGATNSFACHWNEEAVICLYFPTARPLLMATEDTKPLNTISRESKASKGHMGGEAKTMRIASSFKSVVSECQRRS